MDRMTAHSDTRPVELVTGPTVTLLRRDVTSSTETDDKGVETTLYTYTELRFPAGEYEAVRAGMLPPGVEEWTADLRRIQRGALLEEADRYIAEANDHITCSDDEAVVGAWDAYRTAMRQYKMRIRDTINQETFPLEVSYPDIPAQP